MCVERSRTQHGRFLFDAKKSFSNYTLNPVEIFVFLEIFSNILDNQPQAYYKCNLV